MPRYRKKRKNRLWTIEEIEQLKKNIDKYCKVFLLLNLNFILEI